VNFGAFGLLPGIIQGAANGDVGAGAKAGLKGGLDGLMMVAGVMTGQYGMAMSAFEDDMKQLQEPGPGSGSKPSDYSVSPSAKSDADRIQFATQLYRAA
jgi:hypothetical protein